MSEDNDVAMVLIIRNRNEAAFLQLIFNCIGGSTKDSPREITDRWNKQLASFLGEHFVYETDDALFHGLDEIRFKDYKDIPKKG